MWCENAYTTEAFTKLSWTPDKVEENDFNLIEKYVCAACDPHNRVHMSHVNRLRFFWFKKSRENKLRKLPPKKRDFAASCFTFNLHWWLDMGCNIIPK